LEELHAVLELIARQILQEAGARARTGRFGDARHVRCRHGRLLRGARLPAARQPERSAPDTGGQSHRQRTCPSPPQIQQRSPHPSFSRSLRKKSPVSGVISRARKGAWLTTTRSSGASGTPVWPSTVTTTSVSAV